MSKPTVKHVLHESIEEAYDTGYREALRDVAGWLVEYPSLIRDGRDASSFVRMRAEHLGLDLTKSEDA